MAYNVGAWPAFTYVRTLIHAWYIHAHMRYAALLVCWRGILKAKISKKLPCPCGACQGKLLTSYVRRQHMKLFVEEDDGPSKSSGSSADSKRLSIATESPSISPGLSKVNHFKWIYFGSLTVRKQPCRYQPHTQYLGHVHNVEKSCALLYVPRHNSYSLLHRGLCTFRPLNPRSF